MDIYEKKYRENPLLKSNLISKIFFNWITPLFNSDNLSLDDLYNVPAEEESELVVDRLELCWKNECKSAKIYKRKPKFYKSLINAFGQKYILLTILLIFDELFIRLAQSYSLRWLIGSISDVNESKSSNLFFAFFFCLTSILDVIIINPISFGYFSVGLKSKTSTSSLIYKKSLKLSKNAQREATTGQLINLLANDVSHFDRTLRWIPYLLVAPLQIIFLTYILWIELGSYCFIGIFLFFLLIPIQYLVGKYSSHFRNQLAKKTDLRGNFMSEIILAIRIIKMYVWERPFSELIQNIRTDEINILKKSAFLKTCTWLFNSSSKIVAFITFIIYILKGELMTAEKAFFALSIFNLLREMMAGYLLLSTSSFGELIVSLRRIEKFLLLEEKVEVENLKLEKRQETGENGKIGDSGKSYIYLKDVVANWADGNPCLENISFSASDKKIFILVGACGSGKSSLLNLLMGEIPVVSGKFQINGKISYASQEAWIFPGSIRQNILFGQKFDEVRYSKILKICALEDDLHEFSNGDLNLGNALSGGQRSRVSLARCLYQEADIYLLDDPLSAVDSSIARIIFEKAIKDFLKEKIVILVTHHIHFITKEEIILLDKGKLISKGLQSDLLTQNSALLQLISENEKVQKNMEKSDKSNKNSKNESKPLESLELSMKNIQQTEEKPCSLSFQTYISYLKSGDSSIMIIFGIISFFLSQFFHNGTDYVLSLWIIFEEKLLLSSCPDYKINNLNCTINISNEEMKLRTNYIWIYTSVLLSLLLFTYIKASFFFDYALKIGKNLHSKMFFALTRAPISFFDENSSGRILNRFTKDITVIDEYLPSSFYESLAIFFDLLGYTFIIVYSNKIAFLPALFLFWSLWKIRSYYMKTAKVLKKLDAQSRSPIFTHLTSTIQGLTTIRVSGLNNKLIKQFNIQQDTNNAATFSLICATRWLSMRVQSLTVLFLTIVTFSFVLFAKKALVGSLGLALLSLMKLAGWFQWGIRQSVETENAMISVARSIEYTEISPEAPEETEFEKKLPSNWPSKGEIIYKNVSLSYEEEDEENSQKLILKNLNFNIKAKEKVGIVGRTGGGKSSIISALFRLTEPQGQILIDGVDIKAIGVSKLRTSISIIPQNPILFLGKLRFNLDPFHEHTDKDIWRVVNEVGLNDIISSLDHVVCEGGNNFSIGQRQLICLGRAILRKTKILVLDEATSNCCNATDNLIQETIKKKFSECTIITIAHRLSTVINSADRILVIENGQIMEFDTPRALLNNSNGVFKRLVNDYLESSNNL